MKFTLGHLHCAPREHARKDAASALSYDSGGLRYEWSPLTRFALRATLDVERLDAIPPDVLRPGGMQPADFWRAWTLAEAACKLADVPILHWIRTRPLLVPKSATVSQLPSAFGIAGWSFTYHWPDQNIVFTCAWTCPS